MKQQTKFKQTEIGMIPEDWKTQVIQDVLIEPPRNGIYKRKSFHGSGVRMINMGELFEYQRIGNQTMKLINLDDSEKKRFLVKEGDLLFARRSLIAKGAGKCSLVVKHDSPMAFESSIIKIRPNNAIVDSEFLFYFFTSNKGRYLMDTILRQVAVSGITGTDLAKLKIHIPTLEEQQSITKILSSLDSKIELNQEMNKTLEAIAQAIFKHWFVDFEFPNEKGRPYKSSGGEMVDSELGEIPKGWGVEILNNLLNAIESGRRPKGGIDPTLKEGVPSIGAENINGLGYYDYPSTKYISQDYFEQMKQGIVQDEDVLLYKDGAKLGRKTMFGKGFPFNVCCVNEHVFILRTNEKLNQLFLYFWLDQNEITENIKNLNANSAQPGINKESVGTLKILVPEKRILDMFSKTMKSVIEKVFLNCLKSRNLSQIRDSLLPKLMSGRIRVPVEARA